MRLKTRAELRARFVRETKRASEDVSELNRFLIDALDELWAYLVLSPMTDTGQVRVEIPIVAASSTLDVPSDFESLIALKVFSGTPNPTGDYTIPEATSWLRVEDENFDMLTGLPQYRLLEGPSFAAAANPAPTTQRLRFFGPLIAGNTVRMTYVTTAPSLGDPDNPADDTSQIDLGTYHSEAALVALARVNAAGREDASERAIAASKVLEQLDKALVKHRETDRTRSRDPDYYKGSRRWTGY